MSLVDRPAGLVAIDQPTVVWPFGAVGECLVQVPDVAELQPVSCQQAHDLQRIAVAELDTAQFPADAAFDQEQVHAAAVAACATGLEAFVDPDTDAALFDVPLTRPSAASWEQGDRRFQCLLGVAGRRIVGDAAHAATE